MIFFLDLGLLQLLSLNLSVNPPDFILKLTKLLLVSRLELGHLQVGVLLDELGCLQRVLRMHVILVQVLRHVLKLVKVSKLPLLIIHDDFLLLFNGCHDLIHFLVEIDSHAVDVVALGLLGEQVHETLLLLLDVDGISTLAHATWWVGTEAEEVTKNVGNFLLLLSAPPLKSASSRMWLSR